jgi:hypothetical protein
MCCNGYRLAKGMAKAADQSTANINNDQSTANVNNDKSTANINNDQSTANINNEQSTANINNDQFTANINNDQSTANIKINDQSSKLNNICTTHIDTNSSAYSTINKKKKGQSMALKNE